MRPPGRRGILPALLLACGLLAGACTRPGLAALPPQTSPEPQPTETLLAMGKRLLAAREPALAFKVFVKSMTVDGLSAEAITGVGIAAERQGMVNAARRYFEHASKLAPESVIAHNNLGVVLYRLKEYYLARDEFRIAYALSSGASTMAARNLNRAEQAIALIEESEAPDPAISHEVIRLGTSEFRIIESADAEAEVIGVK